MHHILHYSGQQTEGTFLSHNYNGGILPTECKKQWEETKEVPSIS
ncbi:hypothetical protein [Xenorhabdus mauleonii]|nr:hypothetical protein [Xenorhabdus mauleonii]